MPQSKLLNQLCATLICIGTKLFEFMNVVFCEYALSRSFKRLSTPQCTHYAYILFCLGVEWTHLLSCSMSKTPLTLLWVCKHLFSLVSYCMIIQPQI